MKAYIGGLMRLMRDDEGQGLTVYALIVALVSVALVAGLIAFSGQIATVFGAAVAALAAI